MHTHTKTLLQMEAMGSALTDPNGFGLIITDEAIQLAEQEGDTDAVRLLKLARELQQAQQDLADVLSEIEAKIGAGK